MEWDREADVIVAGSGAGALTAAVVAADSGLQVEVIERAPLLGGTCAFSGGMTWIPCNRWEAEARIPDSREESLTYIFELTAGLEYDPGLVETYVDRAAEAVEYLADNTPIDFRVAPHYGDYYDRPGAKHGGGRSLAVRPFASRDVLGSWEDLVRLSLHIPRLDVSEPAEYADAQSVISMREREGIRVNGAALSAGLVGHLLERQVTLTLETRAVDLVVEDGVIVGVIAEHDGHRFALGARRGVVLGCGGFEWNDELVQAFLGIRSLKPQSPPWNEGDALLMGMRAGAGVANMTVGLDLPVTATGYSTFEGHPRTLSLARLRGQPGCIAVNSLGRRFGSEGAVYIDLVRTIHAFDPRTEGYPNEKAWLIFDQNVKARTVQGDLVPGQPTPSWVLEAATIEELAAAIEVPADNLVEQVARWNSNCDRGEDPDFGRGTIWFEGANTGHGADPAKTLGRIEQPPFFAVPLYHGANGTGGGLRVDADAQVQTFAGETLRGLYAVGGAAASIFGPTYPGGGMSLGQGVCFGYLAGLHLAAGAQQMR